MGHQVIKQPDGQLAIFSSGTDTIIMWDATREDVVEYFVKRAADEARRSATDTVDKVADGRARDAYFQFTLTWDEALELDREHDGQAWQSTSPSGP